MNCWSKPPDQAHKGSSVEVQQVPLDLILGSCFNVRIVLQLECTATSTEQCLKYEILKFNTAHSIIAHCQRQCIEVCSVDQSMQSAQKFFTFIFRLSGWALMAPSSFALQVPATRVPGLMLQIGNWVTGNWMHLCCNTYALPGFYLPRSAQQWVKIITAQHGFYHWPHLVYHCPFGQWYPHILGTARELH